MNEAAPIETNRTQRLKRALAQALVLVCVVPLGILSGWYTLSPSPEELAGRAAGGVDSHALLELVRREPHQEQAARVLLNLVQRDAAVLNALASLAMGYEEALNYLISLARSHPHVLSVLADLEMSYDFAKELLCHISPSGIPQLRQHAENCGNACFLLGIAYETGTHVPKDKALAARWYGEAMELGYEQARSYYRNAAYEVGEKLNQSAEHVSEAMYWIRAAAEQGHAAAQCALGAYYAERAAGKDDLNEAIAWYRRSAEQGYALAQYNLGWCYLYGEGVPADAKVAASWFRKAANQGDDMSQYYLGRAHELGEGVRQDYNAALYWYFLAVENGNAAAMCALGYCYAQGIALPQNWNHAVYWFRLSAEKGRIEAMQMLVQCYEQGVAQPWNEAEIAQWRARLEKLQ